MKGEGASARAAVMSVNGAFLHSLPRFARIGAASEEERDMKDNLKIPYGVADFKTIRNENRIEQIAEEAM